jgi:anti-anti-sigma factor
MPLQQARRGGFLRSGFALYFIFAILPLILYHGIDMKTKREKIKGFIAVSLIGEMEPEDAERFEGEVLELIRKGEKNICLDLAKLDYISSSGLRAFINVRKEIEKISGRLVLSSLQAKVMEVFRISKLLSIFEVVAGTGDIVI